MSWCPHVAVSWCPHIVVSPCPHTAASQCPHVAVSWCPHVVVSPCPCVPMSRHPGVPMSRCPLVPMSQCPHHTYPLSLIHALEGVLWQRVIAVAQPGHHGAEELRGKPWGGDGASWGGSGFPHNHPHPRAHLLLLLLVRLLPQVHGRGDKLARRLLLGGLAHCEDSAMWGSSRGGSPTRGAHLTPLHLPGVMSGGRRSARRCCPSSPASQARAPRAGSHHTRVGGKMSSWKYSFCRTRGGEGQGSLHPAPPCRQPPWLP